VLLLLLLLLSRSLSRVDLLWCFLFCSSSSTMAAVSPPLTQFSSAPVLYRRVPIPLSLRPISPALGSPSPPTPGGDECQSPTPNESSLVPPLAATIARPRDLMSSASTSAMPNYNTPDGVTVLREVRERKVTKSKPIDNTQLMTSAAQQRQLQQQEQQLLLDLQLMPTSVRQTTTAAAAAAAAAAATTITAVSASQTAAAKSAAVSASVSAYVHPPKRQSTTLSLSIATSQQQFQLQRRLRELQERIYQLQQYPSSKPRSNSQPTRRSNRQRTSSATAPSTASASGSVVLQPVAPRVSSSRSPSPIEPNDIAASISPTNEDAYYNLGDASGATSPSATSPSATSPSATSPDSNQKSSRDDRASKCKSPEEGSAKKVRLLHTSSNLLVFCCCCCCNCSSHLNRCESVLFVICICIAII
jgi:hypothetical protein